MCANQFVLGLCNITFDFLIEISSLNTARANNAVEVAVYCDVNSAMFNCMQRKYIRAQF